MLTISKPLSASQAQTYHAKEFTAGYDVEAGPRFSQKFQDGQIAIGFDRVTNLVRNLSEGFFVSFELVENRRARVDIAGRAVALGDVG